MNLVRETNGIKFFDDMSVSLVECMGGDWKVCAAAKVSTDPVAVREMLEAEEREGAYGLIKYLARQRHGSPFEHTVFTFHATVPIVVVREWERHRIASYSEESGRYHKLQPHFYLPPRHRPLIPAPGYKSARPQFVQASDYEYYETIDSLSRTAVAGWMEYEQLMEQNIALEVARMNLPLHTYVSLWCTMNLRSLFNYLSLRTHEPEAMHVSFPMWEIEQAARAIEGIVTEHCPLSIKAWNEAGRIAV